MADPTSPTPWWQAFLDELEKFIKDNWSGLAVLLYDYEEQKIDAAKQNQKTAELKEKLAEDETKIREAAADKSDDAVISEQLGTKSTDDSTKS